VVGEKIHGYLLLPPGVAEGELDAGVDARVAVSEGGAGDVDAVSAEVDGAAGAEEVVEADAALRGEVEDAGIGVFAIVLGVVGWSAEGWVLVVGPEEASCGLAPKGESLGAEDVPAEDDRGDGGSGVGAAYGVEGRALGRGSGRVGAEGALEFGRVGLPEGEGLDGVLEVAAQGTVAHVAGEDLAGVDSCHDELEVVAIFGEAEAALHNGSDLEGLVAFGIEEGIVLIADDCLGGGGSSGGEQEGEGPEGGRSKAYELLDHLGLRCWLQKKAGCRRRPPVHGGRLGLSCRFRSMAGVGDCSFVEVEVGVDVLRVVEVFDSLEEADHGVGLSAFEFGVGRGDLGDLGVLGGDLCSLEGFGDCFEVLGVAEDLPVFAFVREVFAAGIEDDLGELVFRCS
jgi:hypothetical protein